MNKILYTEVGPGGKQYEKGAWKAFAIHTDTEIKGFFGPYRFLSNFWPARVILDGVEYKSVENAYQASKWKPEDRAYFLTCTELESIKYNRGRKPNGYSDADWLLVRVDIMKNLVTQKFDPTLNPTNTVLLKNTGTKYLEELNWWGDVFWGTNEQGVGESMLGKILMEVRESIV
jgi:ribA/ribD-fused uncharacterized protein